MNYYFITGTSRGIGKAAAELLLRDINNFVYGFSRSINISADNYAHSELDLSVPDKVKEFEFPDLKDAESIVLVNNSAALSEVLILGKRDSENMIETYNVNIVSPSLLMNSFLKKYQSYDCKRMIINISSGAAYRPIEAWSTYCASKAALAMISEVADVEQKLRFADNPVHIFSVGPGVVDTQMQTNLRKVSEDEFSMVGLFIDFHKKNELAKPDDVALKLINIIEKPENFEKVAINIKDIK